MSGQAVLQTSDLTAEEQAALRELEFELTKPHTLEEIADFLGMPLVTVFDIEKRALGKMRKRLVREGKESWQGPLSELDEESVFPK